MENSLQTKIYEIARKELGVQEIPGKNNNPRIIEYHSTCTLKATNDETPWCSAFVNWSVIMGGGVGTNNAMARSWLLWGEKITDPEVGDIVVLRRGSDGISGHVGFVAEKPKITDLYLKVYGGNQQDAVCVAKYFKSGLLGYRRIKV